MIDEFPQTRDQVARGSRPDAIGQGVAYLIKPVAKLRLTYQIRLLTLRAEQTHSRLEIVVSPATELSKDLVRFARQHDERVKVRRGTPQ
ncbi:MAG: hypothetical protein ACF8NJ_01995 [Phycisphaerales bacterium JB038]